MHGELDWTGHPLVDVGVATLCAMAAKSDPKELTLEDLDSAAAEMKKCYFSGALASYLTCVFMNAEYVQPEKGLTKAATRERYSSRVLFAHRAKPDVDSNGGLCAFSGKPATARIHRGQMPMLTGESVLNFFPHASGGLLIAGPYLTAIQALPLGGRRSEGKLLVAHSDDPVMTLALARRFLEDNRRLLALALAGALPQKEGPDELLTRELASFDSQKKRPKYPDAKSAFTLIAHDLQDILQKTSHRSAECSITAYWLSSSGQGPGLQIFAVPSQLIRFLNLVRSQEYRGSWEQIVAFGWRQPDKKQPNEGKAGKKGLGTHITGAGRSRNRALVDLFSIYSSGTLDPTASGYFVKRHFFPRLQKAGQPAGPSWDLTQLFLTEILGMSPDRVRKIKEFADRLADYIKERNDKQFFRGMTFGRQSWEIRNLLVKVQRNQASKAGELLFSLDQYLDVFEADDSIGIVSWSLVRDLLCIRLVERLHALGWLTPDMIPDEQEDGEPVSGE